MQLVRDVATYFLRLRPRATAHATYAHSTRSSGEHVSLSLSLSESVCVECTLYGRSSGERARRVSTHRKHKQPCLELINANGLVRDAVERQRVHPYANPRPRDRL